MAWERSFEARVLKVRDRELKYQKLNYHIEVIFNAIWYGFFARRRCGDVWTDGVIQGCLSDRRRSGLFLALCRLPR